MKLLYTSLLIVPLVCYGLKSTKIAATSRPALNFVRAAFNLLAIIYRRLSSYNQTSLQSKQFTIFDNSGVSLTFDYNQKIYALIKDLNACLSNSQRKNLNYFIKKADLLKKQLINSNDENKCLAKKYLTNLEVTEEEKLQKIFELVLITLLFIKSFHSMNQKPNPEEKFDLFIQQVKKIEEVIQVLIKKEGKTDPKNSSLSAPPTNPSHPLNKGKSKSSETNPLNLLPATNSLSLINKYKTYLTKKTSDGRWQIRM